MAVSEKTTIRRDLRKKQILSVIRAEGETSRTAVKRISGLSMETTLSLMDELLHEGLIEDAGKAEQQTAGRKATLVRIRPEGRYYIGVRFSASGLTAVCTDLSHRVVAQREQAFAAGMDGHAVLEAICGTVAALRDLLGERASLLHGIGIGAPGILNVDTGTVVRYVHIAGWENVPIKALLEQRFGVPVYVDHGVRCTAKLIQETEQCPPDMLLIQMDRGVNLCAIAAGSVVSGSGHLAGEIGHIHVAGCKRKCDCGHEGCLETEVSLSRLITELKKTMAMYPASAPVLRRLTGDGEIGIENVCRAADLGDADCAQAVTRAAEALGKTLSSVVLLLNPSHVEIVGALSLSRVFCRAAEETLMRECLPEMLQNVRLRFSGADHRKDAEGAAYLPYRADFDVSESVML